MDKLSIKAILEAGAIVICDTNVYLRLYDYSPQFADFGIQCLSAIKDALMVTYTTGLEYKKHYMAKYAAAKTKIENYNKKLDEITQKFRTDISNEFERIEQYHFPDTDELKAIAITKIDEIKSLFDEYYDNHELLVSANEQYLLCDPVKDFFDTLSGQILSPYTIDRIYELCDEGKKRFKNNTPPGFKDKDKDGIRQYSDYILWSEILDYSSGAKKDIVFVTDDVKTDWWENSTDESGNLVRSFHAKLVTEFAKRTGQTIYALTSNELFSAVSSDYNIEITDEISMVLSQTMSDYIDSIKYKAFDKISDELLYSLTDYIDDSSADIGSEGLDNCELECYDLIECSLLERNDNEMTYRLLYEVEVSATSCEYWGRDEDTKEIITSPENQHTFTGTVELQVTRVVTDFVDLLYENEFDDVFIVDGNLTQTNFVDGNKELYDQYEVGENYCPKCGKVLSIENDALNGFCVECTEKYDI